MQGYKVKFITLFQLATRLLEAKEMGRIEKALGDFRALDLLIIDEWGKIVADEQLAAAMIDRIVHFGHLIDTGKVDWRLRLSR